MAFISIATRNNLHNKLGIPLSQPPIKVCRIVLDHTSMGVEIDSKSNVHINSKNDRLAQLIDFLEEHVGMFSMFSDNDLAYIICRGNGWDIRMNEELKWVLDIDLNLAVDENTQFKPYIFELSLKYS